MHSIFEYNNLPFWTEDQISQKQSFVSLFEHQIRTAFQERNRAWFFERIESPMLIPRSLLSDEYDDHDIYILPDPDPNKQTLALRPETTPATYAWMQHRLLSKNMLPYACWQINKSFRREQDQPSKHVRLKEFYQQEFQCVYSSDSFEDWQSYIVPYVKTIIEKITQCPTRIVVSDRLPSYSVCTIDIEVWNSDKWMEICSISKRIDFSCRWDKENKTALVCEIATSPDRQWFCAQNAIASWKNLPSDAWVDDDWTKACISNTDAARLKNERLSSIA